MQKQKNTADNGLPLGFGMALAQNAPAMERFSHMPASKQAQYIEKAHRVRSKQEMTALVNSLQNDASR